MQTIEMNLRTFRYDNDRLKVINESALHRIKVLEMTSKKRQETHRTELFEMKSKIEQLESLLRSKVAVGMQSPELHLSPRHVALSSSTSSSRSSISSPLCFPSFSSTMAKKINNVHAAGDMSQQMSPMSPMSSQMRSHQISQSPMSHISHMSSPRRTLYDDIAASNTAQLQATFVNRMHMMAEDYTSLVNATQERTLKKAKEHTKAVHEQRKAHRHSLRMLRQEYGELQLSVAKDSQQEIAALREEHQKVVQDLVQMFQRKCNDLVMQRDEYAEEADTWRKRNEETKRSIKSRRKEKSKRR